MKISRPALLTKQVVYNATRREFEQVKPPDDNPDKFRVGFTIGPDAIIRG